MPKPNIILIFTDNQMAETLACYGNAEAYTPNLDRMAKDGIRFANAFCANGFCSPCRASLLTGKLPSQHGVHSWLDDRKSADWPEGWHALSGQQTLPETLQELGYKTGLFGKYHLGDPSSPAPGWDHWVTMADGHVRSFYDNRIFDNGDIYQQPGHSVDFFTDKALNWVAGQTEPYFAYLPLPAPYGHWPATNDGKRNRHAARFDDCPMTSIPRHALSPEAVTKFNRVNASSGGGLDYSMLLRAPNDLATLRNYYSQVTMIDEAVGRIMQAAPDAMIVFTTDHGLSLGHHGFWGHGAGTYPSNLHHAAHSIPLIIQHSGHVPSGQVEQRHISNTDLFSTLVTYAGGTPDLALPSRSFASLLQGQQPPDWGEDAVYAEQEETRVIRTADWLYFKRCDAANAPDLPDALFDLRADPGETTNLINSPDHAEIAADLSARITRYFAIHARPEADLWAGGQPLQNSAVPDFWKATWGADWQPVFGY